MTGRGRRGPCPCRRQTSDRGRCRTGADRDRSFSWAACGGEWGRIDDGPDRLVGQINDREAARDTQQLT